MQGISSSGLCPTDRFKKTTYDNANRKQAETDPRGNTTIYTKDDAGRLTAVTDAENNVTRYVYDDAAFQYYLPAYRMPLLSVQQKCCIARILKHVLLRIDDRSLQQGSEALRMERILRGTGLPMTRLDKPGRVRSTVTDLTVPAKDLAIKIQRTYDSLNTGQSSDFGYGWSLGTKVGTRICLAKCPGYRFAQMVVGGEVVRSWSAGGHRSNVAVPSPRGTSSTRIRERRSP